MLTGRKVAACLALVVSIGACGSQGGVGTYFADGVGPAPTLPPGLTVAGRLPGEILDIAADPTRGTVWVPVQSDDGTSNVLTEWNARGEIGTWPLPAFPYAGVNLRIKVDAGGFVWLKVQQLVVRFDPTTDHASSIAVVDIPNNATGAAGNLNAPGGGVAITALGISGTAAMIARRNVPSLSAIGPTLSLAPMAVASSTIAGARDIASLPDGTLLIATDYPTDDILQVAPTGAMTTIDTSAGRLTTDGDRVLASDGSGSPAWIAPSGTEAVAGIPAPDAVAPDPRGGLTAVVEGRIVRIVDGMVTDEVDIPRWSVATHAGPVLNNVPMIQPGVVVTDTVGVTWLAAGNLLVRVSL